MKPPATLLWLRHDLRLADHEALVAAVDGGGPVVPVFVWAPEEEGEWPPGPASRRWLGRSLVALERGLRARGSRLVLRRGPSAAALSSLAAEVGARTVRWHRRHEPAARARDARVAERLRAQGLAVVEHDGALLFPPELVARPARRGGPYRVFTPFARACMALPMPPAPLPPPSRVPAPSRWPASVPLSVLGLAPEPDAVDEGTTEAGPSLRGWEPGEAGAKARLDLFAASALRRYAQGRDRLDQDGTSRLSPHLHFGELSPRSLWHAALVDAGGGGAALRRQLLWREFAHHLLVHFPHTATEPMRGTLPQPREVSEDDAAFLAWREGRTGYPLVDAAMRELKTTGFMHNRARMVAASFLVKHLLVPWQQGARWFWQHLFDADLANNTLGWQWVAGCGADAVPYFRVFNPHLQAARFDPERRYVARYLSAWGAPPYPRPIVAHEFGRARALAFFRGQGAGDRPAFSSARPVTAARLPAFQQGPQSDGTKPRLKRRKT